MIRLTCNSTDLFALHYGEPSCCWDRAMGECAAIGMTLAILPTPRHMAAAVYFLRSLRYRFQYLSYNQ